MAKKTPGTDLNEPAPANLSVPDAVAALPPDGPSVTTAPDGTLVVTTTEVKSSNATISVQPTPLDDSHQSAVNEFLTAFGKHLSEDRKILAAAEHDIQAVGQWPTRIEHALALPLADELDTLHEVEGLVIASFMDIGDVVRKVYLNVLGHFVKA